MSLGDIVRQRRREQSLTQDEVAARVGISKPYLSNIETGRVKNPPSDGVIRELEKALGFQRDELRKLAHLARTPLDVRKQHEDMSVEIQKLRDQLQQLQAPKKGKAPDARAKLASGRKETLPEMLSAGKPVVVINRVAAGYPHHFTDLDYPPSVADEYVRVPDVHDPQAFATRVVGDSMEPRFREGDLVVFAPNIEPRNGDDCFVRFSSDNSTTFKRFSLVKDKIRLSPRNEKYESKDYESDEINGLWPAVMRIERLR